MVALFLLAEAQRVYSDLTVPQSVQAAMVSSYNPTLTAHDQSVSVYNYDLILPASPQLLQLSWGIIYFLKLLKIFFFPRQCVLDKTWWKKETELQTHVGMLSDHISMAWLGLKSNWKIFLKRLKKTKKKTTFVK